VVNDDVDDEGQAAAEPPLQRRTDDTEELALHHALPSKFWEEVVRDYQLRAILDVAAGDGSLALTAVRHRLPYTGIVFTICRKDLTIAHLLGILSARALQAGDTWYDPSLAKTLAAAAKRKNDEEAGQGPATKKQQNKRRARKSLTVKGRLQRRCDENKRATNSKTKDKTAKKTGQEGEREQPRGV